MLKVRDIATEVLIILTAVVLFLVVAGIVAEYSSHYTNYEEYRLLKQFVRLFQLDGEANIPAWFSSSLLLQISLLLAIIAYAKKKIKAPYYYHWALLSLIFLLLSIDEASEIHERLNIIQLSGLAKGIFYFGWVPFGLSSLYKIYFTPSKEDRYFVYSFRDFVC